MMTETIYFDKQLLQTQRLMQTSFNISHDLTPVIGFFRCRLGNQRAEIAWLDGWQNSSANDKKKEILRKEVALGSRVGCKFCD